MVASVRSRSRASINAAFSVAGRRVKGGRVSAANHNHGSHAECDGWYPLARCQQHQHDRRSRQHRHRSGGQAPSQGHRAVVLFPQGVERYAADRAEQDLQVEWFKPGITRHSQPASKQRVAQRFGHRIRTGLSRSIARRQRHRQTAAALERTALRHPAARKRRPQRFGAAAHNCAPWGRSAISPRALCAS